MKIYRTLLLLLCLTFTSFVYGQSKYQKYIDKIKDQYDNGAYDDAWKLSAKLQKKASKKHGPENTWTALGLIYQAQSFIGTGELIFVQESLEEGLNMSKKVDGENTPEHGYALILATDIMIDYGHLRLAKDYNDQAWKAFTASESLIDDIKAKLEVQKAKILSGQGFYAQAIELVEEQEDFYLQKTLIDDKGLKEEYQEEYAELQIVKANSLRKMGAISESDQAFQQNLQWVEENLKRTHYLWGKNAFLNAKLLEENGLAVEVQRKLYEDAYILAERKYEDTHRNLMLIRADLMRSYYADGRRARMKILQQDFKRAVKSFPGTSIYQFEDERLGMEFDIEDADIDRIENEINRLLNFESLPLYHQERIELLDLAKKIALLEGSHINTEAYDSAILTIKKELYGDYSPIYHFSKIDQANFFVDYTDQLNEAGNIYENSFFTIVKPEINENHPEYLNILNHLAKYYKDIDNYAEASKVLNDALLIARKKYDNRDIAYGKELSEIATLQIDIGEYENAQENIDNAIEIISESDVPEAPSYLANAYINEAKLLAIKGDYDESEDLIFKSEKLRTEGALTLDAGTNLSLGEDLASLYLNIGRYADAKKILDFSILQKKKDFGNSSRKLIYPYVLMARLNLIQGDYTESEQLARKANTISVSIYGNESSKIVPSMLQLADVYTSIGDYDKSENLLKTSIKIQKEKFGTDHVDVANSTSNLALVYFYKDRPFNETQALFQEAESIIARKLGADNPAYAEILKNLAIINAAAGNYTLAFSYIDQAEAIWSRKIGKRNNINAAISKRIKGDIYYQQKNYNEAEGFYEKASKEFEKVFSSSHPEFVKVQSKLSKTYFMQERYKDSQEEIEAVLGNYKGFIENYFPALSEREKAKFWNTIKGDYEFYNTLIVSRNRSEKYIGELYNNALLTKALLLSSSIKVRQRIMNSGDEQLISLYSQWIENKELLTAALSMSATDLMENGINPQSLTTEVEQLEKELSLKSEFFAESSDDIVVDWEKVQNSLGEDDIAMEMVRFRFFDHSFTDSVMYALLYVRGGKGGKPQMILLDNGEELEGRYLKTYRNSIKYKIEDRFSYEQFWKPINDELGTVATLYLSPDGVYNQINLEAIPTPDGNYVIDNSNIVLISNTKDLFYNKIRTKQVTDAKYAMMFGNPEFYEATQPGVPLPGSGLTRSTAEVVSPLPGTKAEIDELTDLLTKKGWRIDSFTEIAAAEEAIKNVANPKVFHVATHGFFQPSKETATASIELNENTAYDNPLLKTGLLLSGAGDILNTTKYNYNVDNGILTAYEAMNLNLDQTDLVVLSACETGLGEIEAGEGVYGLQRSFMVAGARTIIMSLFKVSDEATQQLMVKFYKKWTDTGDKRKAFIEAKKEIRNEYQDPIYWGPFVMIGLD